MKIVTKEGKYYIIDVVDNYRLIEVVFAGEENKPLYKIYKGKECVKKWRSDQNLHSLDPYQVLDSTEYQEFLDYLEDNSTEDLNYDLFGLPQKSTLGKPKQSASKEPIYSITYDTSDRSPKPKTKSSSYPSTKKTGFYDEFTKSNTLVFHKTDSTTTMLDQIYEGKGWDVLHETYSLDTDELFRVVDAHERIVCLGHGTGYGLMGMFGPEMAPHLKNKKLFVIWCNADQYFTSHGIGDGQFITGNMPSEVWECRAAGCGSIGKQEMLDNITYWSKLCADVTENCLNGNVAQSVEYIRNNYIREYGEHPVTRYNAIRTKIQGTSMEQNEQEVDEIYNKLGIEVQPVINNYYSYGGYRGNDFDD